LKLIHVTENLMAGKGGNRVTQTVCNADCRVQSVKQVMGLPCCKPTPLMGIDEPLVWYKGAINNAKTWGYADRPPGQHRWVFYRRR
jgi:hypothetical protein